MVCSMDHVGSIGERTAATRQERTGGLYSLHFNLQVEGLLDGVQQRREVLRR